MKRWFRRIGKVLLGLSIFWTLVHGIENWRGRRAWETWRKDQIAHGAIYDLPELQGPSIPDADNFAKAPVIQERLRSPELPLFPNGFILMPPKERGPNWRLGRPMDLKPWMDANHTTDLVAFLATAAPRIEELREATKLPGCRFDLPNEEADASMWPLGLRSAARVLNLRVVIALRNGRAEAALQDVLLELRLTRQIGGDSTLIAQMTQGATAGITMPGLWEGLQARVWNDAQLASLEDELHRQDELTPFRAWGCLERINTNRYWSNLATSTWRDKDRPWGSIVGHALIPRGWIYRNMLAADQHLAETWLLAIDPNTHRVYPERAHGISDWWNQHHSTPYTFLAKDLSNFGDGVYFEAQLYARRQVNLDEAFIVCALERYHLAHKAYPDSLEGLTPICAAKLPCDVFSGAPYRYGRKGDGFYLYSVGWNGTDEGGLMAMKDKDQNPSEGDWPWPQAKP